MEWRRHDGQSQAISLLESTARFHYILCILREQTDISCIKISKTEKTTIARGLKVNRVYGVLRSLCCEAVEQTP